MGTALLGESSLNPDTKLQIQDVEGVGLIGEPERKVVLSGMKSILGAIFIFAMVFQGCTSMRPISPTAHELADAKQNEFLRVHFKDGTIFEGKFQYLSEDSIRVGSRSFALESIQFIERSKISGAKTAGAVVGTLLGAYVVAGLVVLGAFFIMVGNALD